MILLEFVTGVWGWSWRFFEKLDYFVEHMTFNVWVMPRWCLVDTNSCVTLILLSFHVSRWTVNICKNLTKMMHLWLDGSLPTVKFFSSQWVRKTEFCLVTQKMETVVQHAFIFIDIFIYFEKFCRFQLILLTVGMYNSSLYVTRFLFHIFRYIFMHSQLLKLPIHSPSCPLWVISTRNREVVSLHVTDKFV